MPQLQSVTPLDSFRLALAYDDGVAGEVDLSSLVGRGVFSAWRDPACFASVSIGDAGQLCWASDIELCADALYLQLTGKSADQVFTRSRAHADA